MLAKHKKTRSVSVSKKEKQVASKVLKKTMNEINLVNSLIGKQSVKWSFSKANRFHQKRPDPSSEFLSLDSVIGKGRRAGFGFGNRWQPSNPRGKDAPPSTAYSIPGSLERYIVGGKISPSKQRNDENRWTTPGPGTYNLKTSIGEGLSCSIKSRHSSIARHSTPPPGAYNPKHTLVENSRYSNISFGARVSADNLNRLSTPGPGSYDLASSFSSISYSPSPKRIKIVRKNSL
jgi:hypothetical protein